MIARLSGEFTKASPNSIHISVGPIGYEVFVPTSVMERLCERETGEGSKNCDLVIYHYLQVEQSRAFPVLVGFLNEIEKEFFEEFISVSGIGPRAALRAINKPISEIAQAIDREDTGYLRSLPGIGAQRAKLIVAKLHDRIGQFALLQDATKKPATAKETGMTSAAQEAIAVLMKLQYRKNEARQMVESALSRDPNATTAQDVLNEVYRQRRS